MKIYRGRSNIRNKWIERDEGSRKRMSEARKEREKDVA